MAARPRPDEWGEDTAGAAWDLLSGLVYPPRFLEIGRRLEISPPALGALMCLERPRTMGSMAAYLHCDPSNVTGIVDGLEARNFAERKPSEVDRRIKVIELTIPGERLRARLVKEMGKPPEWLRDLSGADQRALLEILERASG